MGVSRSSRMLLCSRLSARFLPYITVRGVMVAVRSFCARRLSFLMLQ